MSKLFFCFSVVIGAIAVVDILLYCIIYSKIDPSDPLSNMIHDQVYVRFGDYIIGNKDGRGHIDQSFSNHSIHVYGKKSRQSKLPEAIAMKVQNNTASEKIWKSRFRYPTNTARVFHVETAWKQPFFARTIAFAFIIDCFAWRAWEVLFCIYQRCQSRKTLYLFSTITKKNKLVKWYEQLVLDMRSWWTLTSFLQTPGAKPRKNTKTKNEANIF